MSRIVQTIVKGHVYTWTIENGISPDALAPRKPGPKSKFDLDDSVIAIAYAEWTQGRKTANAIAVEQVNAYTRQGKLSKRDSITYTDKLAKKIRSYR